MYLHRHLTNVGGYQGTLNALQDSIDPGEVTDEDVVPMPQNLPVHEWRGGPGNGKRGCLAVLSLPI